MKTKEQIQIAKDRATTASHDSLMNGSSSRAIAMSGASAALQWVLGILDDSDEESAKKIINFYEGEQT